MNNCLPKTVIHYCLIWSTSYLEELFLVLQIWPLILFKTRLLPSFSWPRLKSEYFRQNIKKLLKLWTDYWNKTQMTRKLGSWEVMLSSFLTICLIVKRVTLMQFALSLLLRTQSSKKDLESSMQKDNRGQMLKLSSWRYVKRRSQPMLGTTLV